MKDEMKTLDKVMKKGFGHSPEPQLLKALRAEAGLTQTQAAQLVYVTMKGYQEWEYGRREIHASTFELLCIKYKQLRE